MAAEASTSSTDIRKSISRTRFPGGLWTLLLLPYLPLGIFLCLLRVCMSLQAILILLVFPEGAIKRFMLRVFFCVLGILVTSEGHLSTSKVLISNKVSYVDHIVLHLACKCVTVSTGGHVPVLAPMFPHWTFPNSSKDSLTTAAKALPEFDENLSVVDYSPYAIQPEPLPTNGKHLLLQFNDWPFGLDSSVHPVALAVFRPFPVAVTTGDSSGWWDLFWMLFLPITVFHAKFLPVLELRSDESSAEFAVRVEQSIAASLKIQNSTLTEDDVKKWLADPPQPRIIHNGPIIPPSEFDPSSLERSGSSELETMVHQVTAVLPQVPHSVIRSDLVMTRSVDATITNLLEGRVKYTPILSTPSRAPTASTRTTSPALLVFRRKGPSSFAQHQLSLEERKKELLQNARRRYMEKHGL